MSIAVSAVIEPPRLLRWALAMHAMASAGASLALVSGCCGSFHFAAWLAAACAGASLLAGGAAWRRRTTRQLDISGLGEIGLTVQQSIGMEPAQARTVHLLPGSTLWPGVLLLLLRGPQTGPVIVLPIFPGSIGAEQFRKIAVAIRSIARRDNKFFRNNKIF